MASSKEYLDFVLEKLSGLDQIRTRPMMGEYILYYREKVIGGIYDNRLLLKPVKSVDEILPDGLYEAPYPGAKKMLLVEDLEDERLLAQLITAIYDELPSRKKK